MLRYLITVRREINVLVIASLFLLAIKILWLNTIPELFHGSAALGEIVDRLCASILSSYLFFLIVVHLKSERDKETVNPYISSRVQRIVGDCISQLSAFQKVSGVELDLEKLTKENIEAAFRQIDPKGQAPLILGFTGQHANWLQFMDYYRTRTTQEIEKLFQKITFLDSQLVQHLANIDDSTHFSSVQLLSRVAMPVNNATLEVWASTFYDYCILARKLDEYEKTKLSVYRSGL
jgi:hypothetical protein